MRLSNFRTVVGFAVAPNHAHGGATRLEASRLFAVCDDGSTWWIDYGERGDPRWVPTTPIPGSRADRENDREKHREG